MHTQFGTIDNPVLIFTSDSSWRIVICMGPGIEDDASSHEKIFYMVREGPINRCQVCGQCFKVVRLKANRIPDIEDREILDDDQYVDPTVLPYSTKG